jgi:hypothetical protein
MCKYKKIIPVVKGAEYYSDDKTFNNNKYSEYWRDFIYAIICHSFHVPVGYVINTHG